MLIVNKQKKPGSPLLQGGVDFDAAKHVLGLQNVLNTRWQFGQCSRGRFVVPNRNGFANLRMQASSTVRLIISTLVDVPSFLGQ